MKTRMTALDLELPKYCEFYKHFLVEEIHYIKRPIDLHYGLCSVIGRMCHKNGQYKLENIRLSCLDKTHRLHTGAVSILLKVPDNLDPPLPLDEYVEIFGEAVFQKRNECSRNDVNRSIGVLSANSGDLRRYLKNRIAQMESAQGETSGLEQGNNRAFLWIHSRLLTMRKQLFYPICNWGMFKWDSGEQMPVEVSECAAFYKEWRHLLFCIIYDSNSSKREVQLIDHQLCRSTNVVFPWWKWPTNATFRTRVGVSIKSAKNSIS